MVPHVLSLQMMRFMSKNNNKVWNTKYGPRRVRNEAPTLEEAIVAAQTLSDDVNDQVAIAASLMGLPGEQVRAALLKATPRKEPAKSFAFVGSSDAPRTVVVERKPSRRVGGPPGDRSNKPGLRAS
jgi:hypothetical protein